MQLRVFSILAHPASPPRQRAPIEAE